MTTEQEAAEGYEQLLAESWLLSGLADSVERPVTITESALPTAEWNEALLECMQDAGYEGFAIAYWQGSGYRVEPGPEQVSADVEPATQLAFYLCLSKHSFDTSESPLLTTAQLDYIYDYYASWFVPCLAHSGFPLRATLTREQYLAVGGAWSPIVEVDALVQGQIEYDDLVALCGPERPALY